MPIGAYGGRRDVMEQVCEDRLGKDDGYVWTASTLGGNPVSTAAASAALAVYRETGVYARLHRLGDPRPQLSAILAERGVTAQILGDGPIAQVAFTDSSPRDYRSARHTDGRLVR